jgi:membrane protein
VIFGASLLLSILPMIILISAYANHHIEEDIAQHLGLSAKGVHVVQSLFRTSDVKFNFGILVGLLLSFAGTIAVARSVQVIYERTFGHPPGRGSRNLMRCVVWVLCVSAIAVADASVGRTLRHGPEGPVLMGLAEFVGFTLFFWWSIHFLLAGRETWLRARPAAFVTGFCWIGLGVFAAFYLSPTIVSDSETYGPIGVTFTLVTWFIAMGAVITLGAVIGAVWYDRRHTS